VRYGRIAALQGISMEVRQGETVALIGHNGAGKSTTLFTITRALTPWRGDVRFEGRSLLRETVENIVRKGISLVPENRRIFTRLTVGENLRIGATTLKDRGQVQVDINRQIERFPILGQYFNTSAGNLSGGEQQQLAIARALLSRPKLLLLDEPSLGLAPLMVDRIFDAIDELKQDGVTILLVEQNAARAIEIADRAYVLKAGGKIEFEGMAKELQAMPDFEASYLGLHA